ncbi:MAG: hypothetical protein GQ553_00910 [Nitrosomonadaceae bacterium]|nr:hypothetical protein [Nitrosomonadaceae bacterium]
MEVVDAYKQHGVLYVTQFEWGAVIWRPLSWDEVGLYEKLFQLAPSAKADLEESIFKDCVVEHPLPEDDFENWQAGIVTTVSNQVLKISSANNPEEFVQRLDIVRQQVKNNVLFQVFARIMRTFPAYSMEDLVSLPLETLFERLAMVEMITGEEMKFQIEKPPPSQLAGDAIDFEADNRSFSDVDLAPPAGDWNLTRRRDG